MKNLIGIAGIAALIACLGSPALAARTSALAPGGRTLAGPGTASIAAGGTETVYSGGTQDACVTVVNTGKKTLEVTLVGSTTTEFPIAAGVSYGRCKDALERIDLVCSPGSSCSAQWRVDDN